MKISRLTILLAFVFCLLTFVTGAQATSIKDRMAARIPQINVLKDKEIIGENKNGYLEYRVSQKNSQQLVADENKDRKSVYTAIGKKQRASAELVGQRRALMIAENGKKGHWYQKADGSWYKK